MNSRSPAIVGIVNENKYADTGGEPRLELGVHRLWNYMELFWNSLEKATSSIVFYLDDESESGSRFTRY